MRVLVTGATGFLGGVVTRQLLARGDHVIGLGRNTAKLTELSKAGAETLACDLTQETNEKLSSTADAVVHCAALSSPWGRKEEFEAANVNGTMRALELATIAGARRFIHISTPSIYFRFCDQRNISENHPLPTPVNAYAATKRVAETLVLQATKLNPIILRPKGLYGQDDTTLLPRLLRAARRGPLPLMNKGCAATNLTHVNDAAAAVIAALGTPLNPAERVFNVSGGEALNVRRIAEQVAFRAGVRLRWRRVPVAAVMALARGIEGLARLRPGYHPEPLLTAYGAGLFAYTQTLDISAARRVLGWSPAICFDEGLDLTFGHTTA